MSHKESTTNEQWILQQEILSTLEMSAETLLTFNNSDLSLPYPWLSSTHSEQVALVVADVGRRPHDDKSLRRKGFKYFINCHQAVKALRSFFKDSSSTNITGSGDREWGSGQHTKATHRVQHALRPASSLREKDMTAGLSRRDHAAACHHTRSISTT